MDTGLIIPSPFSHILLQLLFQPGDTEPVKNRNLPKISRKSSFPNGKEPPSPCRTNGPPLAFYLSISAYAQWFCSGFSHISDFRWKNALSKLHRTTPMKDSLSDEKTWQMLHKSLSSLFPITNRKAWLLKKTYKGRNVKDYSQHAIITVSNLESLRDKSTIDGVPKLPLT